MPITPRTSNEPATTTDPGKSIAEAAKEQATKLVQSISTKSLVELTDMRDHIDTLMMALKQREEHLIADIEGHAALAHDVISMKFIVRDNLEQLIERVQPVAATVTHRRNGHE